jgi:hypothetical protein
MIVKDTTQQDFQVSNASSPRTSASQKDLRQPAPKRRWIRKFIPARSSTPSNGAMMMLVAVKKGSDEQQSPRSHDGFTGGNGLSL